VKHYEILLLPCWAVIAAIKAYLQSKGFISAITTATHGAINHYKIIDAKKDNKLWTVTLLVAYSHYQSVTSKVNQALNTIAILPFKLGNNVNISHAQKYNIAQLLYQALQTKLAQTNTFRVMDRSKADQKSYDKEMQLILSNKASQSQKSRFSQQIGADYLLVGTIQDFIFKEVKKRFYGEDFNQWRVSLVVNYRLLETATMQILEANTVSSSLPSDEVVKMLNDQLLTRQDVVNQLISKTSDQIPSKIVSKITSEKQHGK